MNNDYNSVVNEREGGLASYTTKVYVWMFVGLLVSAYFAFTVASSSWGRSLINPGMMLVLGIIELGLVIGMSWGINKISSTAATIMFLVYSALNGATLAVIFYVYEMGVISQAFIVSAAVFGVMALYGYATKTDLTKMGNIFMMAIIGLIVASIVNIFLRSSMFDLILSYITVFIFSGLVAYDSQKIKAYYEMGFSGGEEVLKKGAILSALALYLDFINIFLALLRIFGNRD